MKTLLFIFIIASACGNPPNIPNPPTGCMELIPVCVCDAEYNCTWQYQCKEVGED